MENKDALKAFGKAKLPETYIPKTATLRDQFAMAALTGMMSNSSYNGDTNDMIAAISYELADAMLKAREDK